VVAKRQEAILHRLNQGVGVGGAHERHTT
jgi:hypothetical protein